MSTYFNIDGERFAHRLRPHNSLKINKKSIDL